MRRRAAAPLAIAAIALLATGCAGPGDPPATVPITQLSEGDCFDTDADFTTAIVYPDCSAPHLYEAHHLEVLEGDAFPGDEAVSQRANEVCDAKFLEFTGVSVSQSETYASVFLGPTEESWMTEDDRTIVCVIMPMDGQAAPGSAAAG